MEPADIPVRGRHRPGTGRLRARPRVVLFTPTYHCGMVESAGVWMPLGLAYLSGSLKAAGYETVIYDAMSRFDTAEQAADAIVGLEPDVVAATAYTASVDAAREVLGMCRERRPDIVTVIGGVHPTFMAEEVLRDPAVDYVVRGEGEQALPELLACLTAGADPSCVHGISCRAQSGGASRIAHGLDRPLRPHLDGLPIDWDGIDWPLYHYRTKPGSRLAISSWSRGCTGSCTFCSQIKMWRGTWRARAVESVIAEVRMLKERFGVDTLEVADEYPTCDAERWEHLLDRLIEEDLGVELLVETRADDVVRDRRILDKYRRAGILHVYVGVESPEQSRLDRMRKRLGVDTSRRAIELLNDVGIITETSFLLGYPDDTPASIRHTIELAAEYDPDLAFFLAVTPWPYSDLYAEVAPSVEVRDYSSYNLATPIIKPDAMSRAELSEMLSAAFADFYRRKMSSLSSMPEHKAAYLRAVAGLLMSESYLSREVAQAMADIPSSRAPTGIPAGVPALGGVR